MDKEQKKHNWHSLSVSEAYELLYSGPSGLKNANAVERLKRYGHNEPEEKGKKYMQAILLSLFKSVIIWIIFIAFVLSILLGGLIEALLVFIILMLSAVFKGWQTFMTEKINEEQKALFFPEAKTLRDGQVARINSKDLVPGDIILLKKGDRVPADSRIVEASFLEADEHVLTGSTIPSKKDTKNTEPNTLIDKRASMLYSGTFITSGRAKAVVVSTGADAQICKNLPPFRKEENLETPLQHKLAQTGEFLGVGIMIACAIVFILMLMKGESIIESLLYAVSLAAAAIPEGMATVAVIFLLYGAQRMVKKKALAKSLPSLEAMGLCNVICTGKTGILTLNQMTVRKIYANNMEIDVTGQGCIPKGFFEHKAKRILPENIRMLLRIGALCNDSGVTESGGKWNISGDPTEAALLVAAKKAGLSKEGMEINCPRIGEIPFDQNRKLMTTIHKSENNIYAYVKGAPEIIIERCDRMLIGSKIKRMTADEKKALLDKNLEMADDSMRVIGLAFKTLKSINEKDIENRLVFAGLAAMTDPVRQDAAGSIMRCKKAGIKVVMITGDNPATAKAIAKKLGMTSAKVMTGSEIDARHHLGDVVEEVDIFARVCPHDRLRIISALKSKNYIVAMAAGDGDDVLAIKRADIGAAKGIEGTDAAKEESGIILMNDSFSSIVDAVEESRNSYDNIRNYVKYILSSSIGKALTVLIAVLIGFCLSVEGAGIILPFAAFHLLLIHLLTGSFAALALGAGPVNPDVMELPPRKKTSRMITKIRAVNMAVIGMVIAAGTLFVFSMSLQKSAAYAATMAFATLVVFELFNALNCMSEKKSIISTEVFRNKQLIIGILLSFSLLLFVVYAPLIYSSLDSSGVFFGSMSGIDMEGKLGTTGLNISDWLIILFTSSSVVFIEELRKFAARRVTHGRA